ncbi:MAG: carboxy terminal-processing peptidase [Bacteroidia bacterium]|nr:carboxy terminal-processing peptidase [Bacteroidia bacterium]MBT8274616.1 carboxy terminal-processing peptidase [Bacteroidia bacterium]NNF31292.1 carboxy terminal-processing peptidase [Flavobacteriaceae bacterium]NNK54214.1 carboxy terminal-processing peptidase [Flavobacteriaceae bacterium]NNM08353.1 carboxy terminal-processing peptidase [Flavobacteriaceae bacterium]
MFSLSASAQTDPPFCDQMAALKLLIETQHYRPKPLDDALSSGIYKLFIQRLDEDKVLFNDKDIAEIRKDSLKFDDYLRDNNCGFIGKYIKTLRWRIAETKQVIDSYKNTEFDYSGKDTLKYYRTRESGYFDDDIAMKKYWSKRLRFEILSKISEEDSILDRLEMNFDILENEVRPLIFEKLSCQLDEMENGYGGLERFVTETFLNAYTNYQDPNSTFFNNTDKTMFENSVSTSMMTFGLYTEKNEDGEIVISYVTPGGAAYFEGSIEEGDVIRSLTAGTNIVETNCISNEEITAFLSDNNNKRITFRIKKKDGTIKSVMLTKKAEKAAENLTRGYVMSGEFPIGYINVPSFYTDFESPHGMGVANDIAKEIYKLKKENIQGLVIDLRFNGGGSMKEASDLCGMFIDRGPVSILKYRNGETFTVRDANRGTVFNKPIVVIQNSYSASASEYFTSVMQDYNRAVIVGTPSYGKSSMQTIVPLDKNREELGFCKITTDLFYRVTGKSNQSKGVIPDIFFPSMYDGLDVNEQFIDFSLPNDSVQIKVKHQPKRKIPLKLLREKSEYRMYIDEGFQKIKRLNKTLLRNYIQKDTIYSLTLKNVYGDLRGYNDLWKDFIGYFEERKGILTVKNTASTEELLKYSDEDKKVNALSIDEISNDIFIEEAYHIIADINNIN